LYETPDPGFIVFEKTFPAEGFRDVHCCSLPAQDTLHDILPKAIISIVIVVYRTLPREVNGLEPLQFPEEAIAV